MELHLDKLHTLHGYPNEQGEQESGNSANKSQIGDAAASESSKAYYVYRKTSDPISEENICTKDLK